MSVQSLGYVGIRARSLSDWGRLRGEAARPSAHRTRARRASRSVWTTASSASSSTRDAGAGVGFFGWEVADAAALDALAEKLEAAGVKVAHGSRVLADERRVKDLIVLADPLGNRVEIFHGAETAPDPSSRAVRFRASAPVCAGMGHVVLHVERVDEVMPFYRDLLGFR